MKVTKFGQSCLLIEKAGKKLLIDPGGFFTEKHSLDELGGFDAVLFTHEHPDHLDQSLIPTMVEMKVQCIYANESAAKLIGQAACVVNSGAGFEVAGFDILPIDVPHFSLPAGYGDPPQNTAYVIDGTLIHPGDSSTWHKGLEAPNLAAPIGGPTGVEFVREVVSFMKQAGTKKAIPIHYDHFKFDPSKFADMAGNVEITVLADGESTEL